MPEIPFEIISCSWPRPVAQAGGLWASEPEWDAPRMPHVPCPSWRMVGGAPCWTIDWRGHFRRDLDIAAPQLGGEMKGFHVVFRLRIMRAGRLVFWDDDGCVIRRGRSVVHSDRGSHDLKRHEIEVFEGEELEVAQWQHVGGWMWGARLAGAFDGPRRTLAETLSPYLEATERRLLAPDGPPLKVYTSGATPLRCVVGIYSMILNGYAPSKVLLYGDYQWREESRRLFAELLPFAEVVPTERVLAHVRSAGGARLAQTASDYWFVMKTFVALLCPPEEFCLLDDDVFILGPLDDALAAHAHHDLVYSPDAEHGEEYLKVWGWLDAGGAAPLPTGCFNAGLYFMRNDADPLEVARDTLRVKPQYFVPYVWEQGYIATLFARRKTLRLPTERYNFPLFDGLPGGPLGYDYAGNPCGFASVHFGGLNVKPSDEATLHLLPHVLGRGLGGDASAQASPGPPAAADAPASTQARAGSTEHALYVAAPDVAAPATQSAAPAPRSTAVVLPSAPLVTCIMPTCDRREFVPQAVRYFQRQDYAHLELLIVDDGADSVADCLPDDPRVRYVRLREKATIGAKRNLACEQARGNVIAHWDDDDWYPPWRVTRQVRALEESGAEVCGTSRLYYMEPATGRAWRYRYADPARAWVAGNTLAYRRDFWARHRFQDVRVGEDTRFVWNAPARAVCDMDEPALCVGLIHPSNTSRKQVNGVYWRDEHFETVRALLGDDAPFYLGAAPRTPEAVPPLVSCIMPTFNRRPFVPLAVESFLTQSYSNRELIVVDDGTDPVEDLVRDVPGVRYVAVSGRRSIGWKRNLACREARGEIIAHWDDDDWYAPERLRYQVEPILAGEADITGLVGSFVLELPGGEFWTTLPGLHASMFVGDVHGGTIVYRRTILEGGLRYPESNLAEDAALLSRATRRGKRLLRLDNPGVFVYVRHGLNAWREFAPGSFLDPEGWKRISPPSGFTAGAHSAYLTAARRLRAQ